MSEDRASNLTLWLYDIALSDEDARLCRDITESQCREQPKSFLYQVLAQAANADGHICDEERQTIYSHMFSMRLDAEDKAFVLDTLMNPSTPGEIAELANGPEQAAEIYLASRIVMDPDDLLERAYLDDLARQLVLPHDLVQELEVQLRGKNFMAA